MEKLVRVLGVIILAGWIGTSPVWAQSMEKEKLEPEDYGQWQQIRQSVLSPDGNWFAYNVTLVDGDGWLTFKKVGSDSTGEHTFMYGLRPAFSNNGRWGALQIGVSEDREEKLREQKKRVKYKLALMDLESGRVDTFKQISGFTFSETGEYLAMQKYKPEEVSYEGSDLIVRHLESGTNRLIGNVSDYAFNEPGSYLAMTLDASGKLGNGIHLMDLSTGSIRVMESDTARYKSLVWNEDGDALAFLKSVSDEEYEKDTHRILAFKNVDDEPRKYRFDQSEYDRFPDSMRVVDYRDLQWAEDDETLFFGIKQWEVKKDKKEAPEDSTKKEEKPLDADLEPSNVEIWHWKDDQIQPRQEVLKRSLERDNHLSAWHLESDRFVQLGDRQLQNVQLTGDGEHAVGYDEHPYEPTFEEEWRDIYLIDVATGEREMILERRTSVGTSPGGEYLYYFWDNEWWAYDISEGREINLTGEIDSRFENYRAVYGTEQQPPFGAGMWAEDDEWVLLYDEYDVYKVWGSGEKFVKLTDGARDSIQYRQDRVRFEEDYLDPDEPIYLTKYGMFTKNRGFARVDRRDRLEELVYREKQLSRLTKAEDADRFVYMEESAEDSPDFFFTEDDFGDPVALTRTNPQQEKYYWSDDELITYRNRRGDKLQGRLLYPANYDPDKKYPMIVYIYELRSWDMHDYEVPTRTSPYNFRRYASEGYFVFEPDINYELRDPGVSAVESVVPAVEKVLESGMVDRDKVGLTGHSWGAYQTTFIITQTDLFSSAVAGAPLTNMVSMYNSIYWNAGITDASIFEISQGRFPDPWWMDWEKFIDNSPIFNIKNTKTPLLVEFGTDDGAVDFNQGVELYTTMRRMQKPFVMLVYEGENHGLAQEENQIDYATRAFEWHEHYLKGVEAANWIEEGLPYLQRPELQEEN